MYACTPRVELCARLTSVAQVDLYAWRAALCGFARSSACVVHVQLCAALYCTVPWLRALLRSAHAVRPWPMHRFECYEHLYAALCRYLAALRPPFASLYAPGALWPLRSRSSALCTALSIGIARSMVCRVCVQLACNPD